MNKIKMYGLYLLKQVTLGLPLAAILIILASGQAHATSSVAYGGGSDPTTGITSAIGVLATYLGVIIPITLGMAVLFWMIRKGISMFKSGSKAIIGFLGVSAFGVCQSHATMTVTAGYDPTTNFTDAITLVSGSLGTIIPVALGVAVIFWMVRKGIAMFKSGSK